MPKQMTVAHIIQWPITWSLKKALFFGLDISHFLITSISRLQLDRCLNFLVADFQSTFLLFCCIIAKPAWFPDWVQEVDWRGCWCSVMWFYANRHLWHTTPTASVSGANCIGFRVWYLRCCLRPITYWFKSDNKEVKQAIAWTLNKESTGFAATIFKIGCLYKRA